MKRTICSGLPAQAGNDVRISGWVERKRTLKNVEFLVIRDYSGMIQVVCENGIGSKAGPQSAVEITGRVKAEPRSKTGVELHAATVSVLGEAVQWPLDVGTAELKEPLDLVLNHRAFSLRNKRIRAVFRIQSVALGAFIDFLRGRGFTSIHTPKIVGWGTEGGADLFGLDYFGKRAFLAQSPQFYKQMMVGSGLERVYETGPVFRAEGHNTSRHLNEYTSLDVEMGFIDSEEDLMNIEEELLAFVFGRVAELCGDELSLHGASVPAAGPIPRLALNEAADILAREYGKELAPGQIDPEGERLLGRYFREREGSDLVFLTHYPVSARPFYALPDPEKPELTRSFDLLFRGLEITTGGMRIHRHDDLALNMRRFGLDPDSFQAYMEVFRQGMPPHGGFAIGAERLTAQILGLKNVREACLFPRDRDRMMP